MLSKHVAELIVKKLGIVKSTAPITVVAAENDHLHSFVPADFAITFLPRAVFKGFSDEFVMAVSVTPH